ncbi:hypothetical protein HY090_01820, partial [Candidatus Kaiserbacteria bacterium]|nr:hypothetical protein [Candidatus Kaiserbacteria bacterium]
MKHIVRAGFITLAALTPAMAFAASDVQQSVLNKIGSLIQAATPIVVAFALLGFFWG